MKHEFVARIESIESGPYGFVAKLTGESCVTTGFDGHMVIERSYWSEINVNVTDLFDEDSIDLTKDHRFKVTVERIEDGQDDKG